MNITKHKNKAFFAPQPLSFVKTVKEALIPRSVLYKLQKNYKTLQFIAKRYKTFGKTVRKALAVCRSQRETKSLQKTPQYSLFT